MSKHLLFLISLSLQIILTGAVAVYLVCWTVSRWA